jgi:hypothetical protein
VQNQSKSLRWSRSERDSFSASSYPVAYTESAQVTSIQLAGQCIQSNTHNNHSMCIRCSQMLKDGMCSMSARGNSGVASLFWYLRRFRSRCNFWLSASSSAMRRRTTQQVRMFDSRSHRSQCQHHSSQARIPATFWKILLHSSCDTRGRFNSSCFCSRWMNPRSRLCRWLP